MATKQEKESLNFRNAAIEKMMAQDRRLDKITNMMKPQKRGSSRLPGLFRLWSMKDHYTPFK